MDSGFLEHLRLSPRAVIGSGAHFLEFLFTGTPRRRRNAGGGDGTVASTMLRSRRSQRDGGGLPTAGIRRGGAGTEAAPATGCRRLPPGVAHGDVGLTFLHFIHCLARARARLTSRPAGPARRPIRLPTAGGDWLLSEMLELGRCGEGGGGSYGVSPIDGGCCARRRRGLCVVLSLRLFRLEICWSLSLGGWWPLNLARRLRRRAAVDRRGPRISF